jgi:hypothetical protein
LKEKTEQLVAMIESETKQRIDTYHDYAPGSPECETTPFTVKHVFPAVCLSAVLIAVFVWGAVSVFPSYFPS